MCYIATRRFHNIFDEVWNKKAASFSVIFQGDDDSLIMDILMWTRVVSKNHCQYLHRKVESWRRESI